MRSKCVFKHVKEKEIFKSSHCFLTISVGQEYHEGAKFAAAIDLISESFLSCKIMLYDTLQRYTMALNSQYDEDYFYKAALREGDLWLDRNKQYIDKLKNFNGIIRWDFWLKAANFREQQDKIEAALADDMDYRSAFEKTVEQYLSRYFLRMNITNQWDKERAIQLCFKYLIEECAALCLWPEENCDFEVYPRARNLAMIETHKRFVLKQHANKASAVELKFKGRNQLRPQVFNSVLSATNKEDCSNDNEKVEVSCEVSGE